MLYLTTDAFREQGFGIDLSSYGDNELRNVLSAASSTVNSHCAASNYPAAHDFRGGSVTNERHPWQAGGVLVFPNHVPVKTVSAFTIYVAEAAFANIPLNALFINRSQNSIEVVSLTITSSVFAVMANLVATHPFAAVSYSYGYSFTSSDEPLYETDGQTFRAANQFWDATVPPVIFVNGVDHTSDFVIDYDEGTATATAELTADDVVSADYTYKLPPAIARATGIIATSFLQESQLVARGMGGIGTLEVAGQIRISRMALPRRVAGDEPRIPDEAAILLEPYRYRSVG